MVTWKELFKNGEEHKKILSPRNGSFFQGAISPLDLTLGRSYRMAVTFDLTEPPFVPSPFFLAEPHIVPNLQTIDGFDVSMGDIYISREESNKKDSVTFFVDFELEFSENRYASFKSQSDEDAFADDINLKTLVYSIRCPEFEMWEGTKHHVAFLSEKMETFESDEEIEKNLPFPKSETGGITTGTIDADKLSIGKLWTPPVSGSSINFDEGILDFNPYLKKGNTMTLEWYPPEAEIKKWKFDKLPTQEQKPDLDMVKHPSHYEDQPIETMEMFLLHYHDRPDFVKGALLFNVHKYSSRASKKNGQEDIDKMFWYLGLFEQLFPESMKMVEGFKAFKQKEG